MINSKFLTQKVKIKVKFLRFEEDEIFFFKNYSIYRIESEFEGGEICVVERSINEFQQLWGLLEGIYPAQVIPPLPESKVKMLGLALQAAFDHEILKEDEYLKSFMCVEVFSGCVQWIKNVEAPVEVKKEYFKGGKWILKTTTMAIDHKILSQISILMDLRDKFEQLIPLFDRLNYETGEVKKSADASEQGTRHLLLLNRLNTKESERTGEFLKEISKENGKDKSEIVWFMNFCIKYIESTDELLDRLNRFGNYLAGKREKASELAKKLDRMQMPLQSKPSFDSIYQTKLKHEKLLEEMAVIEVTYEKYLELVEKELNWIFNWIKVNFRTKLQ